MRGLVHQVPPLSGAQQVLVQDEGLDTVGVGRGVPGADDGEHREPLLPMRGRVPHPAQCGLPAGGVAPQGGMGGGGRLGDAAGPGNADAVHLQGRLEVAALLLGPLGVAGCGQ